MKEKIKWLGIDDSEKNSFTSGMSRKNLSTTNLEVKNVKQT
jgi:hypothetical protein